MSGRSPILDTAPTFSHHELGGTAGIAGEVVATMSDGTTREAPFDLDSFADRLAAP
jgi:hypothetical protein